MQKNRPIDTVVENLTRLRVRRPLVHCLTNHVVKGFTANVLLALGAAPAMVEHPEEAEEFAAMADALLVNVGTLDVAQMPAIRAAVPSAGRAGKPWVLDPVAVGPLGVRTRFVAEMLIHRPALVRGNASEIMSLAGLEGRGRGVESGSESEEARHAAAQLVEHGAGAVLVSGRVDHVIAAGRHAGVANGHPLMTRVTGVGCAMGAIAAAFCAVADNPFDAALATAMVLGVAGEMAVVVASRPGSFQVALVDALDAIDESALRTMGRLE